MVVRNLGHVNYLPTIEAMKVFTQARGVETPDELWVLEHPAVFTQGIAGKEEHLLAPGEIEVIRTDRGGQVTYHGPGQVVIYFLLDIRRLKYGVRQLVNRIEQTVVDMLADYQVEAAARRDAPGVYVSGDKVCSLGLRIRKGCSFHGLALNVNMDMEPFARINPCGLTGIKMVQTKDMNGPQTFDEAANAIINHFTDALSYSNILQQTGLAQDYVKAS